mgnify:CR=1 FL=1
MARISYTIGAFVVLLHAMAPIASRPCSQRNLTLTTPGKGAGMAPINYTIEAFVVGCDGPTAPASSPN